MVARFAEAGLFTFREDPAAPGKYLLDLEQALLLQARRAGLREERIYRVGLCTHCAPNLFSHRRDRGRTGRMWGLVMLPPVKAAYRGPWHNGGMLFPREVLPSLLHLTPAWLKARGLKGVILDLDNTLLPYGEGDLPEAYRAWLSDLKGAVPVYLLSNALPERFARVQRLLDLPGHAPALKPWFGFRKALKALGLPAREVAAVGDQVFTDVLGGNLVGAYTVLVPLAGAGVLLHPFHTHAGSSL